MTEYDALFARAREVAEARGQVYGTTADPLANVNRASALMGHPPWRQALSLAAEALTRLTIADERGQLTPERAEEWLRDAANFLNFAYLDIMKGATNGQEAPQAPDRIPLSDREEAIFWATEAERRAERTRVVPEYLDGPRVEVPFVQLHVDSAGAYPVHDEYRDDHAHDPRDDSRGWPNHRHSTIANKVVYANDMWVSERNATEVPAADGNVYDQTETLPKVESASYKEHGYYDVHTVPRNDHHHGPDTWGGGYVLKVNGEPIAGWPCHKHAEPDKSTSAAHRYGDWCD